MNWMKLFQEQDNKEMEDFQLKHNAFLEYTVEIQEGLQPIVLIIKAGK